MSRRRIIAGFLAAGLLGMSPCAAFGDVSARAAPTALCQTLHETVQPALAAVMKNDGLLETADRAFASGSVDHGSLRSVSESLARNLTTVNQLLAQKLPEDSNAATRASEELMKSRLQAVATAQNDALNVIQGYTQNEDIARVRSQTASNQPDPNQVSGGFNDDVALHDDFHNVTDPAKPIAETRVGSPARLLHIVRSQIGDLEDNAGIAIMSVVKVCNSPQHP